MGYATILVVDCRVVGDIQMEKNAENGGRKQNIKKIIRRITGRQTGEEQAEKGKGKRWKGIQKKERQG